MLNHECDISKLLDQAEAIALAEETITGVDDLVKDTTLLYGTPKPSKKKGGKPKTPKPKGDKQTQVEDELDKAKGKVKQARDKLIKTTQEKLQSLAEKPVKAPEKKPPSVASIVAKTIAEHHDKHPDEINAEVHKALGTVPSKEIDEYINRQIDLYRARRADMFKRLADNAKKKQAEQRLKQQEKQAGKQAEQEATQASREFERNQRQAKIDAYKANEATKKAERDAFRKQWREDQVKYNKEQRKAQADSRKAYRDLWRELTKNDPAWQQDHIKNRLLENALKGNIDPRQIKRDFETVTGLAYMGQGDIKDYLQQIEEAKKIADPYEKQLAIAKIQRKLNNEVPNTVSNWLKTWIRAGLLSSPAGTGRDIIGTELEGQLLSGVKPQLPSIKLMTRFYKEALQGVNTMGSDVAFGDMGTSPADGLRLPPAFRRLLGTAPSEKVDKVLEKYATYQDAIRNSVAKAVYQQHYDYVMNNRIKPNMTDTEKASVRDVAMMAGANATYSPIGKLSKKKGGWGYIMASLEAHATEKITSTHSWLEAQSRNPNHTKEARLLFGAIDVGLTAFLPFGAFMVRLGVRSVTMAHAPWVAIGHWARLIVPMYKAKSLNVRSFMTVEESMQHDIITARGLVSAGGMAVLGALIEAGVLMVPDSTGEEDDERLEKQVGLYTPQFNWSQLVRIATGQPIKTQENDLVISLGAFPMTSFMAYLANGYRKGLKLWGDEDQLRSIGNAVAKGYKALFLDTPANQTMNKLLTARNEEGESDILKGLGDTGANILGTLIPLIVRRPIEVGWTKAKTNVPDKQVATLPALEDKTTKEKAPAEAKHLREQAIADEMGLTAYLVANIANSVLNPLTAERLSHAKAMVAEAERTRLTKDDRERYRKDEFENKLTASPHKFDPATGKIMTSAKARKKNAQRRHQEETKETSR